MELKNKIQNIHNQLFSLLSQFKLINSKSFIRIPLDINKMIIGENKLKLYSNRLISKIEANDLCDVTVIKNYAFYDCNNLTSITIPNSVIKIGDSAFRNCTSLTSITIPDSVTTISSSAFYSCDSLTEITIGNGVTTIGSSVFLGTNYYKNVSNWENNVLYIGKYLIQANNSFSSSYTIKDSTKVIANNAFLSCDNLTSITIPDSVITIGSSAFSSCDSLTEITIGNGVTTIGWSAFQHCNSLIRVTIPNSVIVIGRMAFNGCNNLTSIYLKSTTPPTLDDTSAIPTTTIIYVPVGSGEAYKTATNWSYHSDRIVEDPEL